MTLLFLMLASLKRALSSSSSLSATSGATTLPLPSPLDPPIRPAKTPLALFSFPHSHERRGETNCELSVFFLSLLLESIQLHASSILLRKHFSSTFLCTEKSPCERGKEQFAKSDSFNKALFRNTKNSERNK